MPTIWTEEQKAEMQRLRDEGVSNNLIGQIFGVSGDIIRKVLVRYNASNKAMADVVADRDAGDRIEAAPDACPPEFRATLDRRGGRPPLRIMPKDFQK